MTKEGGQHEAGKLLGSKSPPVSPLTPADQAMAHQHQRQYAQPECHDTMIGLPCTPGAKDAVGIKAIGRTQSTLVNPEVYSLPAPGNKPHATTQQDASDELADLASGLHEAQENDDDDDDDDDFLMEQFEGDHEDIRNITLSGMLMRHLELGDSDNSNDDEDENYAVTERYGRDVPVMLDADDEESQLVKKRAADRTITRSPEGYDTSNGEDDQGSGDGDDEYGTTIDVTDVDDTFYGQQGNRTMVFMSKLTSALADGDMSLLPLDRTMNPYDLPNCTLLADTTILYGNGKRGPFEESVESKTETHRHHPVGKMPISFLDELNDYCLANPMPLYESTPANIHDGHPIPSEQSTAETLNFNQNALQPNLPWTPDNHIQPNRSNQAPRPAPIITRNLLDLPRTRPSATSSFHGSRASSSFPAFSAGAEALSSPPPLASTFSSPLTADTELCYRSAKESLTTNNSREFFFASPTLPPVVHEHEGRVATDMTQLPQQQQQQKQQQREQKPLLLQISTSKSKTQPTTTLSHWHPLATHTPHHHEPKTPKDEGDSFPPITMIVIPSNTRCETPTSSLESTRNASIKSLAAKLKAQSTTHPSQLPQSCGRGFLPPRTRLVASGARHTVVATEKGEVYSWWWREEEEEENDDDEGGEGRDDDERSTGSSATTVSLNSVAARTAAIATGTKLEDRDESGQPTSDWLDLVLGRSMAADSRPGSLQGTTTMYRPGLVFIPVASTLGGEEKKAAGKDDTVIGENPSASQEAFTIHKIVCSDHASFVLMTSGELWGWGTFKDAQGQPIGLVPSGRAYTRPERLCDTAIKDVACGRNHILLLTATGEVITWGSNDSGQLGRRCHHHRGAPEGYATKSHEGAQDKVPTGQDATAEPTFDLGPFFVSALPSPNGIIGIGAGKEASYCWDASTLYGWGDILYGPEAVLGGDVAAPAATEGSSTLTEMSVPLRSRLGDSGSTAVLGSSGSSGSRNSSSSENGSGSNHSYGRRSPLPPPRRHGFIPSTRVNARGRHYVERPTAIPLPYRGVTLKQVQGGSRHTVILTKSGLVLTMGEDEFGQLGISTPPAASPYPSVEAMAATTTTTTTTATATRYTANATGIISADKAAAAAAATSSPRLLPVLAPICTGVKEISCGAYHTIVCTERGQGYIWGKGYQPGTVAEGSISSSSSCSSIGISAASPTSSSCAQVRSGDGGTGTGAGGGDILAHASPGSLVSSSSSPLVISSLCSSLSSLSLQQNSYRRRGSRHAIILEPGQRILKVSALTQSPHAVALIISDTLSFTK
ncbi:hypothetical protein DFQ27_006967 [Actinomortierella ambigua]|uniref:Uncharacterized protein n=1 Tax=Actinomortierella ambigua TaxID=1343610 RepID=A0A9P6UAV9_9FUNG|nr:hypothetical protein DFQ27_006967 [Actinomortierella ambigua]